MLGAGARSGQVWFARRALSVFLDLRDGRTNLKTPAPRFVAVAAVPPACGDPLQGSASGR